MAVKPGGKCCFIHQTTAYKAIYFPWKSLLGDFFRTGNIGDWGFLSNFTVFTRWYVCRSGINNMPGNFISELYEK
ncbi:hypothetical protein IMSAG025_01119 [Muribaculaceae bacterium]|nr:hypothetical protein IMSAG025_01119 [Muribaculaceae bacterium]